MAENRYVFDNAVTAETGAGGGSIASWLAKQAGPTGSVPAAWPRSGEGRDLQRVQDEPELIGCHPQRGWSARWRRRTASGSLAPD